MRGKKIWQRLSFEERSRLVGQAFDKFPEYPKLSEEDRMAVIYELAKEWHPALGYDSNVEGAIDAAWERNRGSKEY